MKTSGWILFALSWGMILLLFIFSLARTLRRREEKPSAGTDPTAP